LSFVLFFFPARTTIRENNELPIEPGKSWNALIFVERSDGKNGTAMEEFRWFDTRSF